MMIRDTVGLGLGNGWMVLGTRGIFVLEFVWFLL